MKHPVSLLLSALLLAIGGGAGCGGRAKWEAVPLGTRADFRGIWFADAQRGWIVGGGFQISGGLVGRTDDGGKTWTFASDLSSAGQASVLAVRFFDREHGLIATDRGTILSTTDGGDSWAAVSRRGRADAVVSLFFLDDRRGWSAGLGPVLRTDDAGEHWAPATPDEDRYRAPGRAIQFLDEANGWLAGMNASLLHTTDGGATWTSVSMPLGAGEHPSFWNVFFVDGQFGWVVGEEGAIFATQDGGASWATQRTGLKDAHSAPKLEHIPVAGGTAVVDAGDRTPGLTITAVRFVDRNHGWVTGFYSGLGRSLILRTDDGGATWTIDADIPGEELRVLFVQGREQLWAVGDRVREGPQSIYRRPIPPELAGAK